ncbi:MAG TPA: amidase [Gemmataceae bacterium]|nr:amidase [Gemmataceae bacterium]
MISTLHAAADDLRAGRTTPLDLLDACLAQIDRMEERVRAWVFVDREGARAEAERRTQEIRKGDWRGPLHGMPIGIKDIFDVFDWPTAAGSRLWKNSIARQDATVVRKLREAGAVFLGKTVTTQYASFDPPPTRNPWALGRTPGGSSSGSAAALACGMCFGALGSQTGGSITRPAAFCGVAGLKPTYGRVALAGVVPLAASMDHPGPMARCVRDLAVVLQVIAGPDPLDPSAADVAVPDYRERIESGIRPPRLGRLRGLFESRAEPVVREMMDRVCAQLHAAGATVVDVALPAAFTDVLIRHLIVMAVEAAMFHEPRLRRHPEDYDPNIRGLLEEGLRRSPTEYARTKEHQRLLKKEMEACFAGVDALLTPSAAGPAPDAATTGDPVFNSPWSYTGLPTVCFPCGRSPEGLPLGLQVVGRAWGEADLLAVAVWCEDVLGFPLEEPTV